MVVDINDVEVRFCAVVGRSHILATKQFTPCFGGLQVEAVIADETENLAIAVNAIVTEHLLRLNISCTAALVGNILYKIGITCHNLIVLVR